MARDQHIDTRPRFLPIDLAQHFLPGTSEYVVNRPATRETDRSGRDARPQ